MSDTYRILNDTTEVDVDTLFKLRTAMNKEEWRIVWMPFFRACYFSLGLSTLQPECNDDDWIDTKAIAIFLSYILELEQEVDKVIDDNQLDVTS